MQKQFMGVAALGAALAAGDVARAEAVQWRVEDGGNGHWYRREAQPLGWPEARARATERGGHLVSIRSQSEYAFIQQAVQLQNDLFWTGGYQDPNACEPACGWRWVTGEPWDYANWNSNEPSDSYGSEHWMECYPGGLWNDRGPGPLVSVVEWSADCNNDGIVDYGQCRDGSLPDYNGNNIPDCCETSTSCAAGAHPVNWRVEDGGNGHWYALVTATNIDWHEAHAAATAQGGHLATISSGAENYLVFMLGLSAWRDGWAGPWLGGYREQGGFRWVDGTSWNFTDWDCMNPSNSRGAEDRLHYGINPACPTWPHPSPTWNDAFGGGPMSGYMVEWSADCNNDGLVDYGQILQGQLADTNQNGVPDSCETPNCTNADLFRDFNVNGADLGILLAQWGPVNSLTVSDLNSDGAVDGIDLGLLLSFWGPCPG